MIARLASARFLLNRPGMEPMQPLPVIDIAAALEYVGGDQHLLQELLQVFLEDCPGRLDALRAAALDADADALMRAAHGLKGALSALSAPAAADLAGRLEQMGRVGRLDEASSSLRAFERELDAVVRVAAAIGLEGDRRHRCVRSAMGQAGPRTW